MLQQYIISLYYAGIIYREKEFININKAEKMYFKFLEVLKYCFL